METQSRLKQTEVRENEGSLNFILIAKISKGDISRDVTIFFFF